MSYLDNIHQTFQFVNFMTWLTSFLQLLYTISLYRFSQKKWRYRQVKPIRCLGSSETSGSSCTSTDRRRCQQSRHLTHKRGITGMWQGCYTVTDLPLTFLSDPFNRYHYEMTPWWRHKDRQWWSEMPWQMTIKGHWNSWVTSKLLLPFCWSPVSAPRVVSRPCRQVPGEKLSLAPSQGLPSWYNIHSNNRAIRYKCIRLRESWSCCCQ